MNSLLRIWQCVYETGYIFIDVLHF
uniref:Uncharacterized protein n=1 Tax=Anguilla anguilla TaxID=7936 RepID=A0A0E9SFV8_ANGAN